MFFDRDAALDGLAPRTRALLARLLPGALTALVPNPRHRFPLACGPDPDTLGVRVPAATPLRGARVVVLQSSANHSGEPEPRTLEAVPQDIRGRVRLVLGAGELPGVASTVVDRRGYEDEGRWSVVRDGAVGRDALAAAL